MMYDVADVFVFMACAFILGMGFNQFIFAKDLKEHDHMKRMKAYERERDFQRKQFRELYGEEMK